MSKVEFTAYPLMTMRTNEAGETLVSAPMMPASAFRTIQEYMDTPMRFLARIDFADKEILNSYEGKGKKDLTHCDNLLGGTFGEDGSMVLMMFSDTGTSITPIMLAMTDEIEGNVCKTGLSITPVYAKRRDGGGYAKGLSDEELGEIAEYLMANFEGVFKPKVSLK